MKDFYENAVGNEKIVERLQFISRYNPYPKELLLILYILSNLASVVPKDYILWLKGWDETKEGVELGDPQLCKFILI